MNNFFLRPWARGPVFSGGDEGGGGGDDNDNAAANREASTGGAAAAPVDPFARSARTQARISTGRQDNMNNRFAGITPTQRPTVTTPTFYDNDNDNDGPSTGSVPPGTGSGIDYTGSMPSADLGWNERRDRLDGVITGNDDPDFFSAPFFQEPYTGNQVVQPNGDVGGPDNLDLDLSPGFLTGLGSLFVPPAGGQTILGRSRNKALAASGDLDGINPQGPTYTPSPEDPSFLSRAYDYGANAVGKGINTIDALGREGISGAYKLSDQFDNLIGKDTTDPLGSMQGQYFDAFGTPVGSAEGIRRADNLRENAAQRVTDMTPGSDYLNSLQEQAQKRIAANEQSRRLFGVDTGPSLVERGVATLAEMGTNTYGAARDYFGRPTDQGGSSLPSVAVQNATNTSQGIGDMGTMLLAGMNEADREAYLRDVRDKDGKLDFDAIWAKTKAASPSAVLGIGSALVNPLAAMAVSAPLYAGEADGDRRSQVTDLYNKGVLQQSDAFKKEAAKFGGAGDLALASVISNISNDSFLTDAALGATLGLAENKILGARSIGKGTKALGSGFFEALEEGGFEKNKTRLGLTDAIDMVDGKKKNLVPEITMTERLNEGIPAGLLGLLGTGFSGGNANIGLPGSGLSMDQAMDLTAQSNMMGNPTGNAVTTPVNTGIAGLQPESNQGPLVGEVLTPFGPNRPKTGTETKIINDAEIIYDAPVNANEFGGTQSLANQSIANRIAAPANEFGGTQSIANQAVFNNLANRTSPTPNDLAGTNIQEQFDFNNEINAPFYGNVPTAPNMDTNFDPVFGQSPAGFDPATTAALQAQAELAARNREASTGGAASTVFADNAPMGPSNPLVSEILAGRNVPTAPNMDTRFDPAGGLGPAGGAATGFADNAPVGVTNPLVAEILAARNAGLAPGMDVNLDPMAGAAINSQVQNVIPSNEQGPTFTPPAAAQRGPDVDPDAIQAMYRNQEMTQAEALRLALLAQQAEAARMQAANNIPTEMVGPANMTGTQLENNQLLGQFEQAKADFAAQTASNNQLLSEFEQAKADFARMQAANNIPTNTLENIMNDIVLESNTGNNLTPVSNNQVIPSAPGMDIRFDPTIDPLTGEVLSPEMTKYTAPKAKRVLPTIDGVVMETNSNIMLNPPVTTAVTTDSALNPNTVLETNNLFPVSPVVPETPGPDDEEINIPTFPDDTSGDGDDDIVPTDDNGNCPEGYILKLINNEYVCVPIEEDVAEEDEEEEEEVVTYGRPRAGSYYQPRTVGRISPYILNSDEV